MLFTVKKIIAYGVFSFAGVLLWANDSLLDNAVIGVEIPHFDEEGRLNWRLQAKEVLPAGENQYEAKDPILRTIAGFGRITDATTSEGVFNVRQGKARGQDTLMVQGDGSLPRAKIGCGRKKRRTEFIKWLFVRMAWSPFQQRKSLCSHP